MPWQDPPNKLLVFGVRTVGNSRFGIYLHICEKHQEKMQHVAEHLAFPKGWMGHAQLQGWRGHKH